MTERFEERVRAALVAGVGDADAVGLAEGARSRLRSRRRTTATVGSVVVAVAAVPVVLALTLPGDTTDRSPVTPPATSDSPSPSPDRDPVADGRRVESWRNLTLQVPDEWGYGGGTDWCAADGSGSRPLVVRPEAGVRSIGCTPQLSYGLHFGDGSAINWARSSGDVWQYGWDSPDQVKVYPEDAWLGLYLVGDHYAMVVAPDQATARAVIDSAARIDGRDANGCAPRDVADAAAGDGDRWSVCRYGGDGWLVQSELLSEADSVAFADAITAAPLKGPLGPICEEFDPPTGVVLAGSGGDLGTISIVFENECPDHNGVFLSGIARELTSDVLYWALSPGWSGGVDGSVPLPDPFRQ